MENLWITIGSPRKTVENHREKHSKRSGNKRKAIGKLKGTGGNHRGIQGQPQESHKENHRKTTGKNKETNGNPEENRWKS